MGTGGGRSPSLDGRGGNTGRLFLITKVRRRTTKGTKKSTKKDEATPPDPITKARRSTTKGTKKKHEKRRSHSTQPYHEGTKKHEKKRSHSTQPLRGAGLEKAGDFGRCVEGDG